jgi:hypothetical protein
MVISRKMQFSTFEPSLFTFEPAATSLNLTRGGFGKDQGAIMKISLIAFSTPPRESSAGPILQNTNLATKFSS